MKEGVFEKIFFYLARLTIIVPIVVVIVAILIRANRKNSTDLKQNPKMVTPSSLKTATNSAGKTTSKEATGAAIFSLAGPLVCNYINDEATISAIIKNKNIFAQINKKNIIENYLLKDDCLYQWEKNKYSGEKFCGLLPYLSTFEQLSSFGLLDFGSLLKFIPSEEINNKLKTSDNIGDIVKQCQKKEVEETIFNIPTNVLFKNSSNKIPQ